MRPAVVILRDVAKDDIRELTRLLSRRPEYNIARPSSVWLRQQEMKIENLPEALLGSKSLIQRFTIGLVSKYDKNHRDKDKLLPPCAVLCHSHERLNAYLIRDIFLTLVYEVSGDYMSALQVSPNKSQAIAAFLTRINSLHALWVGRETFEALFGTVPCDDRYVQVQNNCEACILSAIGANERILADLCGWLTVRRDHVKKFNEQLKVRGDERRKRPISSYRVVDAWIKHLKPEHTTEVRRRGDVINKELKQIWESITKTKYEIVHRSKKEKHHEVYLSKKGKTKMIEVRGRSHGFGIPLPRANLEPAAVQRNIAGLNQDLDVKRVPGVDTIVDNIDNSDPEQVIDSLYLPGSNPRCSLGDQSFQQLGDRPGTKPPLEPFPQSFTARVSSSRSTTDDDELFHHEYGERDSVAEFRSAAQIQSWYQKQIMTTAKTNVNKLDQASIHPAFRYPMTCQSAVPSPLHLRHSGGEPSSHPAHDKWSQSREETPREHGLDSDDERSVWTDASIYTTTDAFDRANISNIPATPVVPVKQCADQNAGSCTSEAVTSSVTSLTTDHGGRQTFSSTSPHKTTVGHRETYRNCHSSQIPQLPPELYKHPLSRSPQTEADRRKYLFYDSDSDINSHLTQNNKKYLRKHSGEIREVPGQINPFARQDTMWKSSGNNRGTRRRPRYERCAALDREVKEREPLDQQQHEHQNNIPFQISSPASQAAPQGNSTLLEIKSDVDVEEAQWQKNWEQEELTPLDSVSNLNWKGGC